jgi:hypothetical protein
MSDQDTAVSAFWAGAAQYVHRRSVRMVRITLKVNCALSLDAFQKKFGGTRDNASLVLRGPEMATFLALVTPHFDGATDEEAWARGVWAVKAIVTKSTIQLYDSRNPGLVERLRRALLRRYPDLVTTGNAVRVNISAKALRERVQTEWMAIPAGRAHVEEVEKPMTKFERQQKDMETAKTPLDTDQYWAVTPVVWDSEEMHALVDAWIQKPGILERILTSRPEGFSSEDIKPVDVVVANIVAMCLNFRPIACFYKALSTPHVTYIAMYVNAPHERRATETMPQAAFADQAVRVLLPHVIRACRGHRTTHVRITLNGVQGWWTGPKLPDRRAKLIYDPPGPGEEDTKDAWPVLATQLLAELDHVVIEDAGCAYTLADVMTGNVNEVLHRVFKKQAKHRPVFRRIRGMHDAVLASLKASRFSGPDGLSKYFAPVP